MDHFTYRHDRLYCEDVPADRIADDVGTPAYVYSAATLAYHYDAIAQAFAALDPVICFSVKCCPNRHVCALLRARGAGFDVVSGGELHRALDAGADPQRIVYAGVGKTDAEILQAIDARIGWFNVESLPELENLIDLARSRRATLRAALRINPDVDPKTHPYTTTGKRENKFGVHLDDARDIFRRFGRDESVRLCGLHLHIGSPVNTVDPYIQAIRRALDLIDALRADGFTLDTLDIGGGFGAHYRADEAPPAVRYAKSIVPLLAGRDLRVILEPGRFIAANAGVLLTRVLYVKESGGRRFVIADAGMNDLIRPALYDAFHFIWPVRPPANMIPSERGESVSFTGLQLADVVGPVCESSDFFAKDRLLPSVKRGDLLAVFTAGAYGMAMASHYNSRPNPAEVLVEGAAHRLIRRRETYEDLLMSERF